MLREIIVFLVAAGLIVPLINRLKVSPVLGFLVVGVLIGPYGLGRLTEQWPWLSLIVFEDVETVRHVAEFGVVFLLFLIGLELSLNRLLSMRHLVFGLGAAQVVITAVVIGVIAAAFGNSPSSSAVLGACLALSSTAIVMQLLIEGRRLGTPTGQTSFAILLFQDLAVVPILFAAEVVSNASNGSGDQNVWLAFSVSIGKAVLAVALILLLGRLFVRPLFRFVGATNSRELFMAAVLLIVIGMSVATSNAGLSLALGAFLAGLLLSESEYRHQVKVDVEPFKGLLLGLFFISIGMELDVAAFAAEPALLLASVAGLLIIKSTIIYGLARLFSRPPAVAVESAILLGQAGEFAFVVIAVAMQGGLIPLAAAKFILLVTAISMLLTPGLAHLARMAAARFDGRATTTDAYEVLEAATKPENHVIIAGYGRVGQLLGRLLEDARVPHVGLDRDAAIVAQFSRGGSAVYYGDASRPRILELTGIDHAAALIITMDNVHAAETIVKSVRPSHPDLPILVRARDAEHGRRLLAAGASEVVPETIEASLDLAEVTFSALGLSDDTAHRLVADQRQRERASLRRV